MKASTSFTLFLGLAIALIAVVAFVTVQPGEELVIRGTGEGIPDQQVSLYTWMLGENPDLSLTAQLVDGKFAFRGRIDNPPAMMRIQFENPDFECADVIVADNSNMSLTLAITDASPRSSDVFIKEISGSPSHDTYIRFNDELEKTFRSRIMELRKGYEGIDFEKPREAWDPADVEKADRTAQQINQVRVGQHRYLKRLAGDNPDRLVGLLALYELIFGSGPDIFESDRERVALFSGLSEPLRRSQFGVRYNEFATQQAAQKAEREQLAAEVAVGKPFKDFTQNDVNGHPVQASDVLSSGRYVLLDFWASWCAPCRAEHPNLLKAYTKYHDKGFDVLAVSLDLDRESWLEAIEKDGTPWIHVSDLKGWDNKASNLYGIQGKGIPMNFLIDAKGTIVASGLKDRDLHDKLEELLGQSE